MTNQDSQNARNQGRGEAVKTQRQSKRSGLVAIMAKEFRRFFTDKRMVITTLLLPGLMIYAVYSVMGSALGSMLSVSKDYQYQVAAVNLHSSIEPLATQAGLDFAAINSSNVGQIDDTKEQLRNKNYDLLVVFPDNFDTALEAKLTDGAANSLATASGSIPDVQLYYNSTRTESSTAYSLMNGLLDSYKNAVMPLFSINASSDTNYDLVTEQDRAGFMLASLLPMLMMIFLFSGAMGVAPESIAGEKERGTIATILVTPLKRWELALGKVVSLSCIALLGGASSFIGVMASLPNLIGASGGGNAEGLGALLYSTTDYLMLFLVIMSTMLVFIGLISLLSAFARSVKEAATLVMPLMIVVMLVGALALFSQSAQENPLFYLIPIYNSVQSMVGIFSFTYSAAYIALAVAVNLLLTGVCIFVLSAMFNSERVVFAK